MRSFADNSFLALSFAGFFVFSPAILATEHSPASGTPESHLAALLRLDPRSDTSLKEIARSSEPLVETAEQQEKQWKAARKEIRNHAGLSNLPTAEMTPPERTFSRFGAARDWRKGASR